MNSRPLCAKGDGKVITPAHFLIGDHLLDIPLRSDAGELSINKRLKLTRHIVDSFWTIWSRNYINTLHRRSKWNQKSHNVVENDVVLIRDDQTDSLVWPMGVVTKTFPDANGVVRNVEIRSQKGVFKRLIQKLVILLQENDN